MDLRSTTNESYFCTLIGEQCRLSKKCWAPAEVVSIRSTIKDCWVSSQSRWNSISRLSSSALPDVNMESMAPRKPWSTFTANSWSRSLQYLIYKHSQQLTQYQIYFKYNFIVCNVKTWEALSGATKQARLHAIDWLTEILFISCEANRQIRTKQLY